MTKFTDTELVELARQWPAADDIDRDIINDLADALERHVIGSARRIFHCSEP